MTEYFGLTPQELDDLVRSRIQEILGADPEYKKPGEQGPVGNRGPKGDRGESGFTGDVGPKGDRGLPGEALDGVDGPVGPRGPKGDRGTVGPQGVPGPKGDTGPQGDRGPEGPVGAQGERGPRGIRGERGAGINIRDTLQSKDDLPSSGLEGEAYLIDGELWVWEPQELKWLNVGVIQGPEGRVGQQGPRGPKGDQGDPGTPGVNDVATPDNNGLMSSSDKKAFDEATPDPTSSTFVKRDESGGVSHTNVTLTGEVVDDGHGATKKYVDDLLVVDNIHRAEPYEGQVDFNSFSRTGRFYLTWEQVRDAENKPDGVGSNPVVFQSLIVDGMTFQGIVSRGDSAKETNDAGRVWTRSYGTNFGWGVWRQVASVEDISHALRDNNFLASEDHPGLIPPDVLAKVNKAVGDLATTVYVDEKIETATQPNFYQDDTPQEGMKEGSLWFDSSDNNKVKLYGENQWHNVEDKRIQKVINDLESIETRVTTVENTKSTIKVFRQSEKPQEEADKLNEYDLWYDEDNGDKKHIFIDHSWESLKDGDLEKLAGRVDAIEVVANSRSRTFYSDKDPRDLSLEGVTFQNDDTWYQDPQWVAGEVHPGTPAIPERVLYTNLWRGSKLSSNQSSLGGSGNGGTQKVTAEGKEWTTGPTSTTAYSHIFTNSGYRVSVESNKPYSWAIPVKNTGTIPFPVTIVSWLEKSTSGNVSGADKFTLQPGESRIAKIEGLQSEDARDIRFSVYYSTGDEKPPEGSKITLLDGITLVQSSKAPDFVFNGDQTFDQVTLLRENLVTNPSFEDGTTGWSVSGGTGTLQTGFQRRMWPSFGYGPGSQMLEITTSGNDRYCGFALSESLMPTVTPGKYIAFASLLANDTSDVVGTRLELRYTGSSTTNKFGDRKSAGFYAGQRDVLVDRVPDTADKVQFRMSQYSGNDSVNIPAKKRVWVDGLIAVQADTEQEALAAVDTYFDGDTTTVYGDGYEAFYSWVGAPHKSTSQEFKAIYPPVEYLQRWTGTVGDSTSEQYVEATPASTGTRFITKQIFHFFQGDWEPVFTSPDTLLKGSVTPDKLLLGSEYNLVANGDLSMGDTTGWPVEFTYRSSDAPTGCPASAFVQGRTEVRWDTQKAPIQPGETLIFEMWAKANKPNSRMTIAVRDQAGSALGRTGYSWKSVEGGGATPSWPISSAVLPTEWTKFVSQITVPPGVTSFYLGSVTPNASSGTERGAVQSIAGLRVYRQLKSRQLEDSSVTPAKIPDSSITPEKTIAGAGGNLIPWDQVRLGQTYEPHGIYGTSGIELKLLPGVSGKDIPPHLGVKRTAASLSYAVYLKGSTDRKILAKPNTEYTFSCKLYSNDAEAQGRLYVVAYSDTIAANGSGSGYIQAINTLGPAVDLTGDPTTLTVTGVTPSKTVALVPWIQTSSGHWVGVIDPDLRETVTDKALGSKSVTPEKLSTELSTTLDSKASKDYVDSKVSGTAMPIVNHGTNGNMARPQGAPAVYWIGSATPVYAQDNDLWSGGN